MQGLRRRADSPRRPLNGSRTLIRDLRFADGRRERTRLIGDTPESHASAKLQRDAARSGQDQATIQALGARRRPSRGRSWRGRWLRSRQTLSGATGNGWLLAYLWRSDGLSWQLVNARILEAGYGQLLTVPPNHESAVKEVQEAALAMRRRLPAQYLHRGWVQDGGLMSYAASVPEMQRRAAAMVDKILRGAKPADLPVEQPTKLELVNLKTAEALGLNDPTLGARAGR
jgi:hypothetical protein